MIDIAGRLYGLTRASTLAQELSPLMQGAKIREYAEALDLPCPIILDEPPGTTTRIDFAKRPQGKWILANLVGGDTLIVTKPDRLGRTLLDTLHTIKQLCERGVRVIVIDFLNGAPLDLNNATQQFTLHILLGVAQYERALVSQRTREAAQYRKAAGMVVSGVNTWGCRRIKDPTRKRGGRLEWDMDFLGMMAEISRRIVKEGPALVLKSLWAAGSKDYRGKPFAKVEPKKGCTPAAPYKTLTNWVQRFRKMSRAGLLPEPYGTLAPTIPVGRYSRSRKRNGSYTPGGTARRKAEREYKKLCRMRRKWGQPLPPLPAILAQLSGDRSQWTLEQWQEEHRERKIREEETSDEEQGNAG